MTRAYDEIYLDDAMDTLGTAVEYAIVSCGINGQSFLELFLASGIAEEIGRGNAKYISGMSGIELAALITGRCGKSISTTTEIPYTDYPPEYWIGWILAYYQWYSGKPFATILKRISYRTLRDLYGVLHEADPSKSVKILDRIIHAVRETNLAHLRRTRGLSQAELAKQSGVSIRSIQLYEQRKADINRAQYNHLKALATVLGCEVEGILE